MADEAGEEDNSTSSDEQFSEGRSSQLSRLPDGSFYAPIDIDELSAVERTTDEAEPGSTSHSLKSKYGAPISPEEAARLMPVGDTGLVYHARIVPDDKEAQQKLIKKNVLVVKKDIDEAGKIRPRRGPQPVILASDFMTSLVRVDEPKPTRWIFSGVLNGWPGLSCLEVRSITCKARPKFFTLFDGDARKLLQGQSIKSRVVRLWSAETDGSQGIPPDVNTEILNRAMEVRVTLRAPPHTANGFTMGNPGLVFWFEPQNKEKPRLLHGANIVKTLQEERMAGMKVPICTTVHLFAHRYATGKRKELPKDKLTYHSALLLEWDHGLHCTVVEMALHNGLGGYAGKCNWYDDKLDALPSLYSAMPPEMIVPWNTKGAEIRCLDVEAKSLEEFKSFMDRYTGDMLRFVDPHYTHSHPARLSFRSQEHIAQYLLNYVGRDSGYSELNRNCQTFAADFYGFLVGKKGVEPFHLVNRVDYTNRSHMFLYDSDMYT